MSLPALILLALVAFGLGFWLTQRWQNQTKPRQQFPTSTVPTRQTPNRLSIQATRQTSPNLEAEVRSLLAQKNAIAAIKLVREQMGMGLKEAKAYIEGLAYQEPPLPSLTSLSSSQPNSLPDDLSRQIRQLVTHQQKIAAIKLVRQHTGWDLKTSKDYVERFE